MTAIRTDVVVIGGGHAGCEAAAASARTGARTVLLTHKSATIGEMSCNPAIGGLGKGHLVREIDALDGLMGRVADLGGIQFRLLNRSKGAAVRGPRAQADRKLYRRAMQSAIADVPGLSVYEGDAVDLRHQDSLWRVRLGNGAEIVSVSVVVTSGTFMRGLMHFGETQEPGGRFGEAPSIGLSAALDRMGLRLGRLKTGTPPRLDGRTIDWSGLDRQAGDDTPEPFSTLTRHLPNPQIHCGITRTTPASHEVVLNNLGRSAMYGGRIESRGPRYCPSIEDKIVRFGERDGHQIFLEPEGLDDDTVYPNGISTSLPADVQTAFLATIPGLERVRMIRPGYAIEYDHVDPTQLTAGLEVRGQVGLFLAGQVNGTTGYEEAAAQGLMAGLNAARRAGGLDPVFLRRDEAYIGVMIDDLITRGVTEPYRMFTSRAEFRLTLRADNADLRLTEWGLRHGLVGVERARHFAGRKASIDGLRERLRHINVTPGEARGHGLSIRADGVRRSGYDLLALPEIDMTVLDRIWPDLAEYPEFARGALEIEATYAVYLERQTQEIRSLARDEHMALPDDLDYQGMSGLSNELRHRLTAVRPTTVGQAGRVEGMTPAALALILGHARRAGVKSTPK